MNNNKAYDDGIDFTHFIGLLLTHKKFLLLCSGSISGCMLLFLVVTALLPANISPFPNTYRPYSTILIKEDSASADFSKLLFPASDLGGGGLSLSKFSFGELAIKIVQSNSIMDTVSAEFRIAERYGITKGKKVKSREAILDHTTLEFDQKTMLLTVGYEDYDPEFATRIVNRLVEELSARLDRLDLDRNAGQRENLDRKIRDVREEIRRLESEIVVFQKKYGFLQVQTLAEEQITTSAQVRLQLMNKEMEIKTKQGLLNLDDPEMKRLYAERDNLKKLGEEIEGGFSSYDSPMTAKKDLPDVARDFSRLQRELAVQAKIYELLVEQYELSKLSLSGVLPMIQVIDAADVPDYKSGPQRTLLMVIGAFVSVVIAILAMIIKNAAKGIPESVVAKGGKK